MRCKRGWTLLCLSAVGAGAAAAADDEAVGRLACRGNEPFWQLQIDGATARYERLGGAAIKLAGVPTPLDYLPRRELVWRGRAAPLNGDLVAWITEQPCLDTMSDREGQTAFSHSIRISLPGGEVMVGCCRRVPRAAASATTDPRELPVADLPAEPPDAGLRLLLDLAPAIEGLPWCHSRPGAARNQGVADEPRPAHPQRRGRLVQVHRAGPGRDARAVRAVPAGARCLPGRRRRASPSPQSSPAGACDLHERVLRAEGEPLGLRSYDAG